MSNKRGLPDNKKMRHNYHFVEELYNRDDMPLGRTIPITHLEVNPNQPREDLGDISDIAHSIKKHGILEPLLVKEMPDGMYRILAGERRYHAAIQAGLKMVPCIELHVADESELLEITLIENLQRKDLTPFEEAQALKSLKDTHGYTQEKISDVLARSRSSVAETLALTNIPEEIRHLCRHADIQARSILLEISKADSILQMRQLVDLYAAGADRETLRQMRKEGIPSDDNPVPIVDKRPSQPFIFRVAPKESDFSLSLRFKRDNVTRDEIIATLREILIQLEQQDVELN